MIFDQLRQIEEKQEVNALKRKYNLNLKATSYQELEDELLDCLDEYLKEEKRTYESNSIE